MLWKPYLYINNTRQLMLAFPSHCLIVMCNSLSQEAQRLGRILRPKKGEVLGMASSPDDPTFDFWRGWSGTMPSHHLGPYKLHRNVLTWGVIWSPHDSNVILTLATKSLLHHIQISEVLTNPANSLICFQCGMTPHYQGFPIVGSL